MPANRRKRNRRRGWRRPGFALIALLALGLGAIAVATLTQLRQEPIDVAAAPAASGQVVFRVVPWAEVEIEQGETFVTPRAQPVTLSAGEHVVMFRHPTLGVFRKRIYVVNGEKRVVRHDFNDPLESES
jgi:hypothetical protein